jgi:hypothetical protein
MAQDVDNQKVKILNNSIHTPVGSLEFNAVEENGYDLSEVKIQEGYSFFSLKGGMAYLRSISDFAIDVGTDYHFSSRGNSQYVYGGDHHVLHQGDHTVQHGDHSKEAVEADKQKKEIRNKIQAARVQAFNSAEGSKVRCRVCSKKMVSKKADEIAGRVVQTIRNWHLWPPYMPIPIWKFQQFLSMVLTPFIFDNTNLAATGKSTCGNPDCKDGLIKVNDAKYAAANKVGEQMLKNHNDDLNAAQAKQSPNATVIHHAGDVTHVVGLNPGHPKESSYGKGHARQLPGVLVPNQNGDLVGHVYGSKSPADPLFHIGQPFIDMGNLDFLVGERFGVASDSLDLKSEGEGKIHAGSLEITTDKSNLTISTVDHMELNGKTIVISGKNAGGQNECVVIKSDNVHIDGGLSVSGNISTKGGVSADGTVASPHFEGRSAVVPSTMSDACLFNSTTDVWNSLYPYPNGHQATIVDGIGIGLRAACEILALLDVELLISTLWNWVMTGIHGAKLLVPISNLHIPTGYALAWNVTAPYAVCPLFTVTPVLGIPTLGIVIPGQVIPIFNQPHVHGPSISGTHGHEIEALVSTNHIHHSDLNASRPQPSAVPTPPKEGMFPSPGPKGQFIGCYLGGAGGLINVPNSNASQGVAARNAEFNIDGTDAFGGLDYVPIIPPYDENGNPVPNPGFSMEYICNNGKPLESRQADDVQKTPKNT